jgi:hypothetical protein
MHSTWLITAWLALTPGASGSRLSNQDLNRLDQTTELLRHWPRQTDAGLGTSFIRQVSQLDLGLGSECQASLAKFASAGFAEQEDLVVQVHQRCGFACPTSLKPGAGPERTVTEAGVEACNPDPYFADQSPQLKRSFFFPSYVVVRGLLDRLHDRLERDGSDQARASWERVQKLLPKLAASLASAD